MAQRTVAPRGWGRDLMDRLLRGSGDRAALAGPGLHTVRGLFHGVIKHVENRPVKRSNALVNGFFTVLIKALK
jgi:hypothetical protein